MKAIIFSKDRAIQLHLLLESLEVNANYFELEIIYLATNDEYQKAYDLLISRFTKAKFIKQSEFNKDVLNCFKSYTGKFITFFVDDCIIYRPFDLKTALDILQNDEDVFSFALRMGKNTTFCYTMQQNMTSGNLFEQENTMQWRWRYGNYDFNYPICFDGHIYRTDDIYKILKAVAFHNPNTMELSVQHYKINCPQRMASFYTSALVNSPSNVVQIVCLAFNGIKHPFDVKILNEKYLAGEVIDFANLDFSNIIGAHQEIDYKFKTL